MTQACAIAFSIASGPGTAARRKAGAVQPGREGILSMPKFDPKFDAVIIGAGHNGMVCATYLAKAGLKVAALERRGLVGGPVVTEEVWPGYRISVAAFWMSLLQPKIMMDLDLRKHGIEV